MKNEKRNKTEWNIDDGFVHFNNSHSFSLIFSIQVNVNLTVICLHLCRSLRHTSKHCHFFLCFSSFFANSLRSSLPPPLAFWSPQDSLFLSSSSSPPTPFSIHHPYPSVFVPVPLGCVVGRSLLENISGPPKLSAVLPLYLLCRKFHSMLAFLEKFPEFCVRRWFCVRGWFIYPVSIPLCFYALPYYICCFSKQMCCV